MPSFGFSARLLRTLLDGPTAGYSRPKAAIAFYTDLMTKLIIRSEAPKDVAAIYAVTESAFFDAPHTSHNEQFILAALRDAGVLTVSLVAEMDGSVVGNVAASPVSISDGSSGWFGLGPVSVIPKLQGRGIGSQLIREALGRLSDLGASGCVVLGEPSYYQRFGFINEAKLVLPDIPPEYFMAMSFGQALPTGTVTYHQAFSLAE